MKATLALVVSLSLLFAAVLGQQSSWTVTWPSSATYDIDTIDEPFTSNGVILPDLNVQDIISVAGDMWNAGDVLQAFGYVCIEMGPILNAHTDGFIQELCDPILAALRSGSYSEAYSICMDSVPLIEAFINKTENHYDYHYDHYGDYNDYHQPEIYSNEFYTLKYLVRDVLGRIDYPNRHDTCYGLQLLLETGTGTSGTSYNSIFDRLLTTFIYDAIESIRNSCSYAYGYGSYGFGDYGGYDEYELYRVMFTHLGYYSSEDELCSSISSALDVVWSDEWQLENLVNTFKTSINDLFSDPNNCRSLLSVLEQELGITSANFSHYESNDDLCQQIYNKFASQQTLDEVFASTPRDYSDLCDKDWFDVRVDLLGILEGTTVWSTDEATRILCYASETTNKEFCDDFISDYSFMDQCTDEHETFSHLDVDSYSYSTLVSLVEHIINRDYISQWDVCHGMTDILYNENTYYTDIFDQAFYGYVLDLVKSVPARCDSTNEEQYGSGYYEDVPFYTTDTEAEAPAYFDSGNLVKALSILGAYDNTDHLCNASNWAVEMNYEGIYDGMIDIASRINESVHLVVTDHTRCVEFVNDFQYATGLGPTNYSLVSTSAELCDNILNAFDASVEITGEGFLYDTWESGQTLTNQEWFSHLLDAAGGLYRRGDRIEELKFLCMMSGEADQSFCESISYDFYTRSQYQVENSCYGSYSDEDNFDWKLFFNTFGDAFGFNFKESTQTCTHLQDILFDGASAQTYTIDYVLQQGMKVVIPVFGPMMCESVDFDNTTEPAAPCVTPGGGCSDWIQRSFQYSQEDDTEMILATIFSYLGGYQDTSNFCHHVSLALKYEADLSDMATGLKESVTRFFDDTSFCEDTVYVISQVAAGGSEDAGVDVAQIVGFNSTAELCETINMIYTQGGAQSVSLATITTMFESEDGDSSLLKEGTIEMIEFASLLLNSQNLGNAVRETCQIWVDSGVGKWNVTEIDHLCYIVLSQDSPELFNYCESDILPSIWHETEEWDDNHSYEYEGHTEYGYDYNHGDDGYDGGPPYEVLDLSTVQICLSTGEASFSELEHLDIMYYLLNTVHKLYNISTFDEHNVCRAIADIINSRKDIPTLISEFAVEWLTIFMPVGDEICSCWDGVLSIMFQEQLEESSSSSDYSGSHFGINEFNEVVLIAVNGLGFDSREAFCQELTAHTPNNMADFAQHLIDQIYDVLENTQSCVCNARQILDFMIPLLGTTLDEINTYMAQFTGFNSVEDVCSYLTSSFSGLPGKQKSVSPFCTFSLKCICTQNLIIFIYINRHVSLVHRTNIQRTVYNK